MIEPNFSTLKERFMCHLEYKKPNSLYEVEYFVHIPTMNFTTSRKSRTVLVSDKKFHEFGRGFMDYLDFYHDLNGKIDQEAILIGSRFSRKNTVKKFHFHKLRKPHEFTKKGDSKVRRDRNTLVPNEVYLTHVQVELPFLYTSSSFKYDGCLKKNFSQIYPVQSLYGDGREVIPTLSKSGAQTEYQTTPAPEAPYIHFFLQGKCAGIL